MMLKLKLRVKTLLSVVSIMILAVSCKKDVDLPVDTCIAGTGGEVSLILKPQHHGDPIPSIPGYPDTAMIKFNVNEFPGDDPLLYDLVVVGNEGDDFVAVNNLKCGKYYIFMTGFDESIAERCKGGIPVNIEEKNGVKTLIIPITED
jgi:hypothetical protein